MLNEEIEKIRQLKTEFFSNIGIIEEETNEEIIYIALVKERQHYEELLEIQKNY